MPEHHTPPPALGLGDIYYILFRHKWKIVVLSALGLLAALVLPLVWKRPYQSEAKLFIKYVLDTKAPSQMGANDPRVKSPDDRGENIINSELEILTSLDVAQQVATNTANIGPDKILAKAGGGADPQIAAALIHRNLLPDVPKKSNVIRVIFQHPDPAIVQPVLGQIIETYLKRHVQIHRAVSELDDFLRTEADQAKGSLKETKDQLRKKKNEAGVWSFEDTKKNLIEQMTKIEQEIRTAETELAERQASASALRELLNLKAPSATNETAAAVLSSNTPSLQNSNTSLLSSTNPILQHPNTPLVSASNSSLSALQSALSTNVPSEKLNEYKRICGLLETLGKREQDLSLQFTPENSLVKSVREQIAANEKFKKQLEDENPELLGPKVAELRAAPTGPAGPTVDPRIEFFHEQARVIGLGTRLRTLTNQLASIRSRSATLATLEGAIIDLQRKSDLQETNSSYFEQNLAQAQIDKSLSALRDSNIKTIQDPSPPFRDNIKMLKAQAMLFFGGIAGALALAFLLELYFDRSFKRPVEIERTLGIPLFLSIPRMHLNGNGKVRSLKAVPKVPLLPPVVPNPASSIENPVSSPPLSASSIQHPASTLHSTAALRPFFDTLRDRLIAFFELKNLTHKPKLVAVTSCGEGAGVTTSAAGLAAALSETGEGNVLLVDMNLQQGAAHHFYKGHLECGLDDALELNKRDSAMVQDNLYVVTESSTNGDQLPRVLPKRFKNLVPKLRASDYDYIIFDMPPVSQISATPRLARFMDMVFLVVESEKTDKDVVKRASALLAESKCNLGVILNKNKAYVPKMLQQEL